MSFTPGQRIAISNQEAATDTADTDLTLQVYLLGSVEFETALTLQRRLAYEVAGNRSAAALILCEHPSLITMGRQASWRHIDADPQELRDRRLEVRWVNRGAGCILHVPGQLAIYPILPLDRLNLGLRAYQEQLHRVIIATLDDFMIRGKVVSGQSSVSVSGRPIADCGTAVRNWVSYYGAYFNINPDLSIYRELRPGGCVMTSLERERHGPLRPALVRDRLLEHFTAQFGTSRTSLFTDHPHLHRKARRNALVTPS